ncbi:3-hydroxybutyryl-CoA dehydrogenase [Fonticula alba]|uniref:3-hydroxybutyryl-CoA dehydrogenase n=1 Tax=Fonticula alba TaxID=691883 RepID=A0A058Z5L2_FONAL|nr:3-hydroxybutyryl-CoA dehydrogenase [Fonticula alba]KCV69564.1 3-hydroxybutyryl-CoA dehydrogenase [Fonticula alba]|eukprot:XP_009496129.1 3-hydroxybutyryl-CoA dehydrogenase [Fonticula alba]
MLPAVARLSVRSRALPGVASRAFATASSADASTEHGVKKFGVVGAGQMGIGIAQVATSVVGLPVVLVDTSAERLEKQIAFMGSVLAKDVAKGRMTEEQRAAALDRIVPATSLSALAECDFVVEAVSEDPAIKLELFRQLDGVLAAPAPGAVGPILASNTSSIPLTRIAGSVSAARATSVIGMHFMNPVPVMELVEVIPALQTADEVLLRTEALARAMGKTTARSADAPGFIANRLLMPMLNEAIMCLGEGIATPEDIDTVMRLGMRHPMGPLKLADFIGLDTCLAIMRVLYNEFGDPKFRPAPLLVRYVEAGWLGKKAGRGFYQY